MCVLLGFHAFYNWLKYTTVTPSFFAKNRLFLERSAQNRNVYADFSETHKSFKWSPLSSSTLDAFWTRSGRSRFIVYFVIITALGTYIFLSYFNNVNSALSPAAEFLHYTLWRAFDSLYFWCLQLQYLLITLTVSFVFGFLNITTVTNLSFSRWMQKYHAEAPVTDSRIGLVDQILNPGNDIHAHLRARMLHSMPSAAVSSKEFLFDARPHSSDFETSLRYLNFFKSFYALRISVQPFRGLPSINKPDSTISLQPFFLTPVSLRYSTKQNTSLFTPSSLLEVANLKFDILGSAIANNMSDSLPSYPNKLSSPLANASQQIYKLLQTLRWVLYSPASSRNDLSILHSTTLFASQRTLLTTEQILNRLNLSSMLHESVTTYQKRDFLPPLTVKFADNKNAVASLTSVSNILFADLFVAPSLDSEEFPEYSTGRFFTTPHLFDLLTLCAPYGQYRSPCSALTSALPYYDSLESESEMNEAAPRLRFSEM